MLRFQPKKTRTRTKTLRRLQLYVNRRIYTVSTIYPIYDKYNGVPYMIITRLDILLSIKKHSFYWLAKETGVSHTTLWRLKKGKAAGINFETLEKICRALQCQPGEVLVIDGHPPQTPKARNKVLS